MRLFKYRKLVKLGKATYKDLCDADEKFTLLQSQGSDAEADRYYHYTIRLANEIYALVSVAWLVFGVDTTKFTMKIFTNSCLRNCNEECRGGNTCPYED